MPIPDEARRAPSPFRLSDQYKVKRLDGPIVSPDGQRVAYIVKGFLKEKNDVYQSLWLAKTDGSIPPHRLTRGQTRDSAPAWSADGRYLAFLSTRPDELEVADDVREGSKAETGGPDAGRGRATSDVDADGDAEEEEPKPQIWILDLEFGGEPRQLTRQPEGVKEFDWSPDGSRLVFSSRSPSKEQAAYLKGIRKDDAPIVIDRMQHKEDGDGYLDDVSTHLFVIEVATRHVSQVTDGPCDERDPRWSPDGESILFRSNRTGDADNNERQDLWLVRPDGSAARRLTFGDVGAWAARFSPDSQHVAFVSSLQPENECALQHLMVVPVAGAEEIPKLDSYVGIGWTTVGGRVPDKVEGDPVAHAHVYPQPLRNTPARILTAELDRPVMGAPVWLDSDRLAFLVGDRGQTRVAQASLTGSPAEILFPGDRMCTVENLDVAAGRAVVGIDRPETGKELFSTAADALTESEPTLVRLTDVNAALMAERTPSHYRRLEFNDSDGVPVEGFVAFPPGYGEESGRQLPLLVSIHGGPAAYDSPSFRFDKQYWAGRDYLVLMVNYRGSTSYGEAFCTEIQGDWGPREHDDVMAGVDEVIRRGWADPDRLFITGFSYGGIMTNWTVGHTDRFRAATSEHGLWDYSAAFGTDDCHLQWQDDMGMPWHNEAAYRRTSPSSGVTGIQTPLLITAGQEDWRCPLDQAELLYVALKKRGVPTQLVIYQKEHHGITKPRRAIDRLTRIMRWLERYGGLPLDDDAETASS